MYSKEELSRIQATEKEMLLEVMRVCKELNIQFFTVGGTTLGAVRHKDFIPWDDDIDLGMMRNDYELFLSEAPHIISNKYTIQHFIFNKHIPCYHMKIMKKGTLFVERGTEHLKTEKGIFLDIMPFDYLPSDSKQRKHALKKQRFYYSLFGLKSQIRTFERGRFLNFLLTIIRAIIWFFILPIKKSYFYKKYDFSLKNCTDEKQFIGSRGYDCCVSKYESVFPVVMSPFGTLFVPLPKEYDMLLKNQYGDYMKIPSKDKQIQHTPSVLSFGEDDVTK